MLPKRLYPINQYDTISDTIVWQFLAGCAILGAKPAETIAMTVMKNPPDPLPMEFQVLTTAEVASVLRISQPTVRQLVDDGELAVLPGMRHHQFPWPTLAAYLARTKVATRQPPKTCKTKK